MRRHQKKKTIQKVKIYNKTKSLFADEIDLLICHVKKFIQAKIQTVFRLNVFNRILVLIKLNYV